MNRKINSQMSIDEQALLLMNKIYQKQHLNYYTKPKHPTDVYKVLLKIGYVKSNKKQNHINSSYQIIPKTFQKYVHAVQHEKQYNKALWNHYALHHVTLKNTTIKVFLLILVVCYCLYLGVSRPDILYNTIGDNIFFGFLFPFIVSFVVADMYKHEMYNEQYHNNREAEYMMYLKGQAYKIHKLYALKKGK